MAKGVIERRVRAFKKWLKRTKKDYARKKFKATFYVFAKRQNAKVRTTLYFRRRKVMYLTLAYFLVAALVSSFSQLWFPTIKPETAFGFYTAAGAMTGGTLAIIFTFNTLLVNFALTQYPPQFFKLSGYDKKQDKIYFSITTITIGLFVMGFMYRDHSTSWSYWLIFLGLLAVFVVFYLVFLSYSLIRQRLNPIASFGYITRPAFKLLDQCEKDARRLADMLHKDPTLTPDKAYIADYQPHMLLQSRYAQVNDFIGYLYDYHDKLIDKKDYSAALMVLDAIGSLMLRYIEVRKDSFIVLPSDYLLVPITDAQKFFDTNFQRMVDRSKVYMELGNQDGLRKIISLFEGTGLKLRELSFPHVELQSENPPFAQCIAYLGYICEEAIKQNDLEAAYQIVRTYAVLGSVAISKRYIHEHQNIYEKLVKLALWAGAQKQSVVMDQIAQSFAAYAEAFMKRDRAALSPELKIYMEKLGEFYWYYVALSPSGNDYQPNTSMYLVQPLKIILAWMRELAKAGSTTRNPERQSAQRDAIELAEQLRRLLQKLSERANVSLSERHLGVLLTDIVADACYILISSAHKNGWQRYATEAISQADWLLNQISFFTNNAPENMESNQLDELANKATNVSLYALKEGEVQLAIDGINVNYNLAIKCLNNDVKSADYGAPRIMVKGGIIALLALQRGDVEVLRHYKEMVIKFNAAYTAKCFPNGIGIKLNGRNYIGAHPDQLNDEIRTISRQLTERHDSGLRMVAALEQPEDYLMRIEPNTSPVHFRALIKYLKRLP
ncbi:MAG: hypothetical protein AAB436_00005 [Patescibacteria group bacterium]